jgi:hypothetical protein
MPWPLQLRRYANQLQRAFGFQGAAALQILDDVSPSFELEQEGAEYRALRGERLCAGRRVQGAVAAQFSKVALINPTGLGVVAIVSRIIIPIAPASGIIAALFDGSQAAFGGAGAGQAVTYLDARLGQIADRASFNPPFPACSLLGVTEAAPDLSNSSTIFEHNVGAFARDYNHMVLMPGGTMLLQAVAVNQGFTALVLWRERPLSPQEDIRG